MGLIEGCEGDRPACNSKVEQRAVVFVYVCDELNPKPLFEK